MSGFTDVERTFVLDPKNPKRADVLTRLLDFLANLPRDKAARIEIGPQIKRRSEQQSRLFHMMCNQYAKERGWTPPYAKAFFKGMCGPLLGEVKRGDKVVELVKSTADYTVQDMSDTITNMVAWGHENDFEFIMPEGEKW